MDLPTFFCGPYEEAMTLMEEARFYMRYLDRQERQRVESSTGLRMSCEAMRVTSRLTQVMAWLLAQRAVHHGEISPEDALADNFRLSGGSVCLDETHANDTRLPRRLRTLMARSHHLYVRIARLEEMMVARVLH